VSEGTRILERGGEAALVRRRCRLEVIAGPDEGRELELEGSSVRVGSDTGSELHLTDEAVSAQHFEMSVDAEGWRLRDLESTNGTWVSGLRCRDVRLGDGAVTGSGSVITRDVPAGALALAWVVAAPGAAHATGETLKRSTSNILMAPFDIALSPVVAGKTIVTNMRDIDDSTAVRVFYAVPGYIFLTGVQAGAGTIRAITGVLEFLPGLGLLFFDNDLDPLYDPVERGEALVDYDTRFLNVKFGIDYTGAAAY